MTTQTNPEIDQDRIGCAEELFREYGYTMFPQQRRIYEKLAERLASWSCNSVLEAGSGNGIGTAILEHRLPSRVTGSDKFPNNCLFAQGLYPWIPFEQWDINESLSPSCTVEVVVAIEVFEHVANPQAAMQNLLDAATKEVWISTPNGRGKPRPPENPYHVEEYTVEEMFGFVRRTSYGDNYTISVMEWDTFNITSHLTESDPLVYRIEIP